MSSPSPSGQRRRTKRSASQPSVRGRHTRKPSSCASPKPNRRRSQGQRRRRGSSDSRTGPKSDIERLLRWPAPELVVFDLVDDINALPATVHTQRDKNGAPVIASIPLQTVPLPRRRRPRSAAATMARRRTNSARISVGLQPRMSPSTLGNSGTPSRIPGRSPYRRKSAGPSRARCSPKRSQSSKSFTGSGGKPPLPDAPNGSKRVRPSSKPDAATVDAPRTETTEGESEGESTVGAYSNFSDPVAESEAASTVGAYSNFSDPAAASEAADSDGGSYDDDFD